MGEPAHESPPLKNRTASGRWAKGASASPGTRFPPGLSGNPGGRPPVLEEIRVLARAHAPLAFRRLCELVKSADESVALRASAEVSDRAVGKPTQSVEVLGAFMHVDLAALSDAELRLHVTRLRERVAPPNGPPL